MTDINVLYTEFAKEIDKRSKECIESVATCNQIEQDLLHFLENEKCDAVAMVKTAKFLKELRSKRRQIKVELDQVECLLKSVRDKDISRFEKRTDYVYRTDWMDDIRETK